MARLTNHQYLRNHELLRVGRDAAEPGFVLLSASEQWDLFQFYLPHSPKSHASLLRHRAEISRLDPSLPQRAGRAFMKLRRIEERLPAYREYAASQPRIKKNAQKNIVLFSEVHPEVNAEAYARAVIAVAMSPRVDESSQAPDERGDH